jgi:pyridoxal 5'-phosphate synthase pdxT subunit
MTIGVLAIQGDYDAHKRVLEKLGAEVVLVKNPQQLDQVDGLVIPGGESSTFLKFLERDGFLDKLKDFVKAKPTFGTCAGAILLASEVLNPAQDSLALMDMTVLRNGYGRQLSSAVRYGHCSLKPAPLEMVFIRAPIIERVGPGLEVLAEDAGRPLLVRHGNLLAATFHPELTDDSTVYSYFLGLIGDRVRA